MKIIEVRRHSMRQKPGQTLTKAGVKLANKIAKPPGYFSAIATSDLGRAEQTAIEMGQYITHKNNALANMPEKIFKKIDWQYGFEAISKSVLKHKDVYEFASKQAQIWLGFASKLNDGENALIISHGVICELAIIALLPDIDFKIFGKGIGYCEGVSLTIEAEGITKFEILRVSPLDYQFNN